MYDKVTNTYTNDVIERIQPTPFNPQIIPWLNDKQIDWKISVVTKAIDIFYDNSTSWLTATNVQDAIDELKNLIP